MQQETSQKVLLGKSLKVTLDGLAEVTDWSSLEVEGSEYTRRGNAVYLKGDALGTYDVIIRYNGSVIQQVTMEVIE